MSPPARSVTAAPASAAAGLRKLARARLWCSIWRFGTLPYAQRLFTAVPPGTILTRAFAGKVLHLEVGRSDAHKLLWLEGERFVRERRLLRRIVQRGGTVLDVGANVGYLALLFAHWVGPRGRVVCVEPDQDNLRELRRNVAANKLTIVDVVAAVAGMERGIAGLLAGLNSRVVDPAESELRVDLCRIDDIAPSATSCLKIDVEGFEWDVLRGAGELAAERAPALWLELHPDLLPRRSLVTEILEWITARYRRVRLASVPRPAGLAAKLLARYGGAQFPRLRDHRAEELERLIAETGGEPFWIVATGKGG